LFFDRESSVFPLLETTQHINLKYDHKR